MRDGSHKAIPLSTKANKWELLSETLSRLPWATVEALDGEGAVLGIVEREDDSHDDDDDVETVSELHALAVILKDIQQTTLEQARRMFSDVIAAQSRLVENCIESTNAVRESYTLAMKVQATHNIVEGAGGEGAEKDAVMQMIQGALALKFGGAMPFMGTPPKQG